MPGTGKGTVSSFLAGVNEHTKLLSALFRAKQNHYVLPTCLSPRAGTTTFDWWAKKIQRRRERVGGRMLHKLLTKPNGDPFPIFIQTIFSLL